MLCETALVTETALARARAGDEQAFRELTDPYRRELQLHCYRILGSVQDAEDALQETLLAAWRALEHYEDRASLRAWLYRIATNRCLNQLRDSGRRGQPESAGLAFEPPEPTRLGELTWLEPYPDVLLEGVPDTTPGPDARYETKETVTLAFLTTLQRLPPRQRAVLVLRDVLGFRSAEAASMLDQSEVSVNSALQRARAALEARLPPGPDRAPLPHSPAERELVGAFADAFENGDIDRVVALLTDDAWLTMPPEPYQYQGHDAIARFLATAYGVHDASRARLVATRANNQPAFGNYHKDPHADIAHARGVFVLTLEGAQISAITRFGDLGILPHFGLPRTLPW
jgi:RNA polymerase sigma-70 factor (TIGR02960 family)